MKRSFLLTAAGLLASLALTTSSQAGNVLVTDVFYSATPAHSTFDYTYASGPSVSGSASTSMLAFYYNGSSYTPYAVTSVSSISTHVIQLVFAGAVNQLSGSFTFATTLAPGSYSVTGLGSNSAHVSAVPEPSTMALLGIGMTSFLAFRRFFKRTPLA